MAQSSDEEEEEEVGVDESEEEEGEEIFLPSAPSHSSTPRLTVGWRNVRKIFKKFIFFSFQ